MDDSVGPFLGRAKFALCWVFCRGSDFSKDEIFDVESFQLHSPIEILGYLLLVLGHSLRCLVSDNALKCILIIYLYGRYLLITMLNLYN